MEGVETGRVVIREIRLTKCRVVREGARQRGDAGFAVVLDRQAEERLLFEIHDEFGLSAR